MTTFEQLERASAAKAAMAAASTNKIAPSKYPTNNLFIDE